MSRPIKFRVWDKKLKEMRNNAADSLFHISIDGNLFFDGHTIEKNRFELMQFTGLLDSEGKEIYEGDIIEREFMQEKYKWKIYFDNGCFLENWNNSTGRLIFSSHLSKIIGNRFENPDILENEK